MIRFFAPHRRLRRLSNFSLLLAAMSLRFFGVMFIEAGSLTALINNIFFLFIILAAVNTLSDSRLHFLIAIVLAAPAMVDNLLIHSDANTLFYAVAMTSQILLLGYTGWMILLQLLRVRRVTSDLIVGSICLYMIIASCWALIYLFIFAKDPMGSFILSKNVEMSGPWSADNVAHLMHEFFYFSVVTLTTLGYGDIQPLSVPARSMAAFQAILGQIYLTVLVARLVGLHISQSLADDSDRKEKTNET